jgi:hypothetical protein
MTNKITNEIEINGEIFIKKSEIKTVGEYKSSPVQIVVLNRGWIVIGNVSEIGSKTTIQNASVIRNWGTENGLGELAMSGQLPETKLDKCPDITVETCNVVLVMNCDQSKW